MHGRHDAGHNVRTRARLRAHPEACAGGACTDCATEPGSPPWGGAREGGAGAVIFAEGADMREAPSKHVREAPDYGHALAR